MRGTIPTRPTLLNRLKNPADQASWKEFFDTYWGLIYGTAIKAGLTDAEAQDVVQETVFSVFKKMPDFEYNAKNGSFKIWLWRLTSWRIADQLRRRLPIASSRPADHESGRRTPTIERAPDPRSGNLETIWSEEWEKNIVSRALERVRRRVSPKQYQMFDLYYLQKWPVRRIAAGLKVSAGWVYVTKHRLTSLLKREIKAMRTHLS